MSDQNSDAPTQELPKDQAAAKGMVNVQIDGHWIQVPKGTRMIEACKIAEKEVPHYCYHPKLSSPGNCRMCLVQMGMPPRLAPGQDPEFNEEGYQEIGWMPRPVIACANTVAENMGIRTKGDLVEKTRNGVMEFLLINHPLDCPICDQAGECRLQEFSVDHGSGTSRFKETKVKKPKNVDIGERIRLDDERCIMCSRCIRFMEEVADDPVLGFADRGTHTTLTVHPGQRLDHNYSLNTADLCPVGALTSTDFRFQQRVWFLKETQSIDVNCGTGINTTIWTREGRVYRITPRQNDAVNSCWMPDSHRLNFHYIDADARLNEVLIKDDNGVHQTGTWADAMSAFAARIKEFEPNQVAIIASGRQTNEELWMSGALAGQIGTEFFDIVPRTGENDGFLIAADRNPNTNGAKLVGGIENPGSKLDEIKNGLESGQIKALIILGEDVFGDAGWGHDTLAGVKFLLTTQISANATGQSADIVLPAAAFTEKRGTMINVTGRLQKLNQASPLPGDAHDDWEIFRDLTVSLLETKPEGIPYLLEDVFKGIAESVEEFAGLTLSKVRPDGLQILETGVTIPLLEREKERIANREIVG